MMDDLNPFEDPYEFQKLVGFRIVAWSQGLARVELPVTEKLGNRYGIPHGGVYATILDTAMGFAGSWVPEGAEKRLAMTLSLNVNFLAQPKGDLLIAEGRRTGGGARVFFSEGRVVDDDGTLVATGTAAFRVRGGG